VGKPATYFAGRQDVVIDGNGVTISPGRPAKLVIKSKEQQEKPS
jgi:hypothetical protein